MEFLALGPLPIAILLVTVSAPTSAYIIVSIGREIFGIKNLKKPWVILTPIILVIQLSCLLILRTRMSQ